MTKEEKRAKNTAYAKRWRAANKEKCKARDKRYREKNVERYREMHTERGRNRRSSVKGLVSQIYGTQKYNQRERGHGTMPYTQEELFDWFVSQPHHLDLMNDYIESGLDKNKVPSVDRLDNTKGYSLDNIQLITWEENRLKG